VLPPGPGLAAWLATAAEAAGGLGEGALADVAAGWRRLAAWAQAGELAAVAELTSRAAARDPQAGVAGYGCPGRAGADAAGQVSLALVMSPAAAAWWAELAVVLRWRLPGTGAALRAGVIDLARAKVIAEAVSVLDLAAARAVEDRVLAGAGGLTLGQLRAAVRRAVILADPQGAQARREQAERRARVCLYPDAEGTATLAGHSLPGVRAAAALARVSALARAMKAAGAGGGIDLLRAQVFTGLLLGTLPCIPPAPGSPPDQPPPGHDPGSAPDDPGQPPEHHHRPADPGDPPDDPGPPLDDPGPPTDESWDRAPERAGDEPAGRRGRAPGDPGQASSGHGAHPPGSRAGPSPGQRRPPPGNPPLRAGPGPAPPATAPAAGARPPAAPAAPGPGPADDGPWAGLPDPLDQDAPADPDPGLERAGQEHWILSGDYATRPDGEEPGLTGSPAWPWPAIPGAGPAGAGAGQAVRGLLELTAPLTAIAGWSAEPGRVSRLGPVTAPQAARLAALAATDPATTWRIILTTPAGTTLATTRLPQPRPPHPAPTQPSSADPAGPGPHPRPGPHATPGQQPGGLITQVTLTVPGDLLHEHPPAPGTKQPPAAAATLASRLDAALTAAHSLASRTTASPQDHPGPGGCPHHRASPGYQPPPALRDYITARDQTCRFPTCRQPATRCDLDHTRPYQHGGPTCDCNLGCLCRHHHQLKQHPDWTLTQPHPGTFTWTTPAGHAYTTTPDPHH
jgi:hypothetical protein